MVKFITALSLLLVGALAAAEPLGTGFTYQGELMDGGAPANGVYDLEFELYDVEDGGAIIANAVVVENVTVDSGVFSVELDFGSGPYAGDQLWLEIGVRDGSSSGGFTGLLPRQKVTAAPYALYADFAATPGDHGHSEFAPATVTVSRWAGCNGPSMSVPIASSDTFIITNNSRGYIGSTTNAARFYCPLNLPQGASMTTFRALLRDTGPTGSGQGLARCLLQRMALSGANAGNEETVANTAVGTGIVGSNGAETPFLLTDPMGSQPVDNDNFVYFIKCDLFQGGSTTPGQLGIFAAQVRYNIRVVPGTG